MMFRRCRCAKYRCHNHVDFRRIVEIGRKPRPAAVYWDGDDKDLVSANQMSIVERVTTCILYVEEPSVVFLEAREDLRTCSNA
jgi:hypothetical protein